MKRFVEYFRCETIKLDDEINRYANLYDLRIASLVVADTIGDDVIAYVIFEEEQK